MDTVRTLEMELPEAQATPLRMDDYGAVRVSRTRVTLDSVVAAHNLGHSADDIARMYPSLRLDEIQKVLTYYLSHRQEVDAYLERRRLEAEEIRRKIEEICPRDSSLREKLLARQAQKK